MTDRQAALREALEREISDFKLLLTPDWLTERDVLYLALLEDRLKRLGHCNTCRGKGELFMGINRLDSSTSGGVC